MREWIVTNGLGGYASLTHINSNTRKDHGLLVASLNPPTERWMFVGALGRDDIARQQIGILEDGGVVTEGISQISGEESGQAYILIDQDGENVIASHPGANARLAVKHLRTIEVRGQLRECRGIVPTDPPLEVAKELINVARRYGVPVLWDPGILINQNREVLLSLVKEAEVLFLNETEASALLGASELKASLHELKKLGFSNHISIQAWFARSHNG